MLGAVIIVFREILEAGLIIGIMLAATKGIPHRSRAISLGVVLGGVGACLVAGFAGFISKLFQGSGQELFNAAVLFFAVLMLAWHNIWMSTHGRQLAKDVRELGVEVASGHKRLGAITAVVAIAVLREGSEVVLFLYGLWASQGNTWQSILLGGVLGLLLGTASTALVYFGLLAIPVRHFFSATAVLITFLAAGLSAQAVAFLQQGGFLESWAEPIWNSSGWLPEGGWIGRLLHILIGYSDQPSGMQLLAYAITVCGIAGLMRLVSQRRKKSYLGLVVTVAFLLVTNAHGAQGLWARNQLIDPQELVQILKSPSKEQQPLILHIGFAFLFKNGHIPGSKYLGPANDEAGLKRLHAEMEKVPRTRDIVIYCGCCPMGKCPNIRPAFKELQAMGFKNVKILSLPDNFEKNWIKSGYSVEK